MNRLGLNPFRRRHRLGRSEEGTTIVELMFVTMLLMIVMAIAFGAVGIFQKNSRSVTDRFTATGEAQTIADRITKDLRAAVATSPSGAPFASADSNDVTFYANLFDTNGPTRLHAYLSTQSGTNVKLFHEDSLRADDGGSSGNYTYGTNYTEQNRIDGKYIDTTGPAPLFQYYDADGNQLTTPITDTPTLQSIDAVQVTIRVRVTPTSPVVVIQSLIHVRNVDYNPNV